VACRTMSLKRLLWKREWTVKRGLRCMLPSSSNALLVLLLPKMTVGSSVSSTLTVTTWWGRSKRGWTTCRRTWPQGPVPLILDGFIKASETGHPESHVR
jgi:hypothetical protein